MKQIIRMILVLTGTGIISGGVLALVNNWSAPLIKANQKAATEAAIFRVHPEGTSYEIIPDAELELYLVKNNNEKIGYAMVSTGNGFQGTIRLIAGVTPDLQKITALEILDQVETPGLGTKVTETFFTNQFKFIHVKPAIFCLKNQQPENPNEVQAVTGATISSKSVVSIINSGIKQMKRLKDEGVLN